MYAVKKYFGRLKSDMVPAASLISAFYAGDIFARAFAQFCYQLRTSEFFEQMREVHNLLSMRHEHIVHVHDWFVQSSAERLHLTSGCLVSNAIVDTSIFRFVDDEDGSLCLVTELCEGEIGGEKIGGNLQEVSTSMSENKH